MAAFAFVAAPALDAQSMGLSMVRLTSDHRLVPDLIGFELRIGGSATGSRLGIRFGFGRLAGDQERVGSTCAGLVPPDVECAPEPIHDDAHFSRGRGELAVALLQRGRSSLGLVGGLVFGQLNVDSRGLTSGRHLPADKTIWGADIGGDGRWFFSSSVPLGLEAAFSVGELNPTRQTMVADGYAPFEQSFGVRRLRVGAVLELH